MPEGLSKSDSLKSIQQITRAIEELTEEFEGMKKKFTSREPNQSILLQHQQQKDLSTEISHLQQHSVYLHISIQLFS